MCSGGWSTLRANVKCAKVYQFYFAFAYISVYLLCFALLNFYFAFYFQFALLLQISYLFFHFVIILFKETKSATMNNFPKILFSF